LSSGPDDARPEEDADPAGEGDTAAEASPVLDALRRHLGDAVVGSEVAGNDVWVRVDRAVWRRTAEVCRDQLEMDYFCFLSGIDWMPNPDLSGRKVWDPGAPAGDEEGDEAGEAMETGLAGGDTRFQLLARLYSTKRKVGVTLKADLDDADPRADSWVAVYRGADWHERETWEMFGFSFDGHPGLRHLYLPGGFEGHPLRKDFPLLAREVKPWPGLVDVEPLPGEAEGDVGDEA
jgi:NADH-quinone oxidoreductase subunit C